MSDPTEQLVEAMARAIREAHSGRWDLCAEAAREICRQEARAALTALRQAETEAGWQCVPKEATTEMWVDGWRPARTDSDALAQLNGGYRNLLAAAPKPPGAA